MRVTAEKKQATRGRILDSARKSFDDKGFEATTTRDIAQSAQIATGTLFNYFPTKEAVAISLFAQAFAGAGDEFESRRRGDESLEEDLFAHVLIVFKRLRPFRKYVGSVMEVTMSPLTREACCGAVDEIRAGHLERVSGILKCHGYVTETSLVTVHLYWTLFMGAVVFWSADASPKQEDSLVLLDQSMRLFAASLPGGPLFGEVLHGA